MTCVLLSLNVPTAVYSSVAPGGRKAFVGVTAIATRVAEVTVSGTEAETLPGLSELLAVIVVVPALLPVATPVLLIVAAEVVELQAVVGWPVNTCWKEPLEQLNVPTAVKFSFVPSAIDAVVGAIARD